MTEPLNATLEPRASLRARRSVKRTKSRDWVNEDNLSAGETKLVVDRKALLRHVCVLTVLYLTYLCVGPSEGDYDIGWINTLGPVVLLLSSVFAGYKVIIDNPKTIWTPVPWFCLTTGMYYGFAPLIYCFGSESIIAYMDAYWAVGPAELWRTNLLNTLSILTVFAIFLATDYFLNERWSSDPKVSATASGGQDPARKAAYIFLGVGIPLRYLLVLPYTFGQLGFTLPGSVFMLNSLVKLALFMLAYLWARRGGGWKVGFWVLFVTELLTNFITFSKLEVIMTCFMSALGRFLAKKDYKELVLSGLGVVGLYALVLSSLVSWCRNELNLETGNDRDRAPVDMRLEVAARGIQQWWMNEIVVGNKEQGWWSRLCYTNAQTACMDFYDAGTAGDTYSYALYGWIPRFIWRDKPPSVLASEFNMLVTGHEGSCTGGGVFGEAYWNGGWLFVILTCAYVGALFAWLSRDALLMLARSEWLLLPCAFLSMMMGLRIDDYFVPNYVLTFMMYLSYYFAIRFLMLNRNADPAGIPEVATEHVDA